MGFGPDSKNDSKEDSPPPYLDATSSVTFTVDYAGWKRSTTILDPTGQPLYASHSSSSWSTRLEISNKQGQLVGASKSSSLSSKIDVQLSNPSQSFDMHNSASIFGGSPGYTSPAFGGKVVWKNKAWSNKIIYTLIDDKGMGVARFESNPKTKVGTLELTREAAGQQRLDEIVVTLVTLLHRKLRNIEASYIAAVS